MVVARRSGRWRAAVALTLLAALAACTADDDGVASPTTGSSSPAITAPTTAAGTTTTTVAAATTSTLPVNTGPLGALDAALTPDGTIDIDAALALVAAGYAPLPGVTPAPAPLVDSGPPLRALVASATELTAEQQTAVTAIVAPTGTPLTDAAASASPVVAAAAGVAAQALAAFGRSPEQVPISILELPYANGDGTTNFSSPDALATAVPVTDDEGAPDCRLRVDAASPTTTPAFVAAVARETFHCVQHERAADAPMWVVEGAAAYAADLVAGANPVTAPAWARWIGQPQRPLPARTADAIGFFALVAEVGDPFAVATALLTDPSEASVRRRLELTDVFDRWGRQYATRPDWEGFAFAAPGAAGLVAPREPVSLPLDGPAVTLGGQHALSARAYDVTVPGDVLVVTTGPGDRGAIRFANGQAGPLAQATQAVCVAPGGCACPGVGADELNVGEAGGNAVFVGIGPSSGSGPSFAARSLPRWCQEVAVPPPADAVDPCLVGTWTTTAYVAPDAPGVGRTVEGGDGATVTFGADRTVAVSMDAAAPVVITSTGVGGERATTTLTYRGAGSGTWRADGGVVEISGVDPASFGMRVQVEADGGSLVGDVDLPVTDVRLAHYATLLGTARYTCTPVSLTLTHVLPGVGATAGFELTPS